MDRMRQIRADISHHDSVERFSNLGIDVFLGKARFVDGKRFRWAISLPFKKAVIATGARAHAPSVPGLAEAGFLTNETVFSLTERPRRLAVIGGGPIGCELAQAFHRLGSQSPCCTTTSHLLNREDAEAAEIVQQQFRKEQLNLVLMPS
jgi:pyruvate/2-oxoglutarate dehydrogenase complex dihydrolipoamide dehydrogenase (E3) component